MTAFVGSRTKFRTRFGQPLGPINVHLIADTSKELEQIAEQLGLSMDERHEQHYHIEGAARYQRALVLGAKPRFGAYWLRVVERVQKRQDAGKWDR
jgi:hypothetical protein